KRYCWSSKTRASRSNWQTGPMCSNMGTWCCTAGPPTLPRTPLYKKPIWAEKARKWSPPPTGKTHDVTEQDMSDSTLHTLETDVLVIGAGGAGMSAAIAVSQAGRLALLADRSLIGRGGATIMAQMTVA